MSCTPSGFSTRISVITVMRTQQSKPSAASLWPERTKPHAEIPSGAASARITAMSRCPNAAFISAPPKKAIVATTTAERMIVETCGDAAGSNADCDIVGCCGFSVFFSMFPAAAGPIEKKRRHCDILPEGAMRFVREPPGCLFAPRVRAAVRIVVVVMARNVRGGAGLAYEPGH
jgi:hypothetical protein